MVKKAVTTVTAVTEEVAGSKIAEFDIEAVREEFEGVVRDVDVFGWNDNDLRRDPDLPERYEDSFVSGVWTGYWMAAKAAHENK